MKITNPNFDSFGFRDLTPEKIVNAAERCEKTKNRIYDIDQENIKEYGMSASRIDIKNINISDPIAEWIAPLIDGTYSRTGYPDIVMNYDKTTGLEFKGTCLRAGKFITPAEFSKCSWCNQFDYDLYLDNYKNIYGFGVANPLWIMPKSATLKWSSHYCNVCNLLAFAWDWEQKGHIVIIGAWLARLNESDWYKSPKLKDNSKNTPCVTTNASARSKLASNWIFIDEQYFDMLKNRYVIANV